MMERIWRTLGENSATFTLALYASIGAILIGTFAYLWQDSEAQLRRALIAESKVLSRLALSEIGLGNSLEAIKLAISALPDSNQSGRSRPFVAEAEAALNTALLAHRHRVATIQVHESGVTHASFSRDGRLIASSSYDNTVRIVDVATKKVVHILRGQSSFATMLGGQFSRNGERILTSAFDSPRIWDVKTGKMIHELKRCPNDCYIASFNNDESRIIAGSEGGKAVVWDAATGAELFRLGGHRKAVYSARFSPDNETIATASRDGTVKIWALNGAHLKTLQGNGSPFTSLTYDPSGKTVVATTEDGAAWVWEVTSGTLKYLLRGHTARIKDSLFGNDGRQLVTFGERGEVVLWDINSGNATFALRGHTARVRYASFHPTSQILATASSDGTVRIWDVSNGTNLAILNGSLQRSDSSGGVFNVDVNSIVFSPDGEFILGATGTLSKTGDNAVVLWRPLNRDHVILRGYDPVKSGRRSGFPEAYAEFSPNGRLAASVQLDNYARLWDPSSGKQLSVLPGDGGRVMHVSFSRDSTKVLTLSGSVGTVWHVGHGEITRVATLKGTGTLLHGEFNANGAKVVTSSWDGTVKIWDAVTGAMLHSLDGHQWAVRKAVFNLDGSLIISCGFDHEAIVWNTETGERLHTLRGHAGEIKDVAFAPGGHMAATSSSDQTIRLWDLSSGTSVHVLEGHKAEVRSVHFDADGRKLVSSSWDSTGRVWDVKSGRAIATLEGHSQGLESALFSPDGRRVLTASRDNSARVFDAASGGVVAILGGHTRAVTSARYSADGAFAVTASDDGTIRITRTFQSTSAILQYATTILRASDDTRRSAQ
jgi:WD40 repeat protein